MRRLVLLAAILACTASFVVAPAYCTDNPVKKLGRGISNCLTSPLEIPNQMIKINEENGPVAGLTWGVVKGIGMAVARVAVGAYETATFPIPVPAYYDPIITEPEFLLDDMTLL